VLEKFLKAAVELDAEMLEIDYKDGQERVCALRGPTGVGIGTVPSNTRESEALFESIEALRKKKQVSIDGTKFRVSVSEYESFGQWAHRIKLTKVTDATPAPVEGNPRPSKRRRRGPR
jgi:hypothetical protein